MEVVASWLKKLSPLNVQAPQSTAVQKYAGRGGTYYELSFVAYIYPYVMKIICWLIQSM